jgi:hypothetical protein
MVDARDDKHSVMPSGQGCYIGEGVGGIVEPKVILQIKGSVELRLEATLSWAPVLLGFKIQKFLELKA